MKSKLTILVLLSFTSAAAGQVTFQWNDVPSQIGTQYEQRAFKDGTVAVDLGSAGENQVWDFTGFELPVIETYEVIDKADAERNADFPDANLVYKATVTGTTEERYNYIRITETELTEIGQVNMADSVVERFARPVSVQPKAIFPVNYGQNAWTTYNQFIVDDSKTLGFPVQGIAFYDSSSYEIDAWGVVKTELGEIECLRVKQYHTSHISYSIFKNLPYENDIIYSWIAPQYGFVLTVKSENGETEENFTTAREISMITNFMPTSVTQSNSVKRVNTYALLDNYPNPFNPVTRIGYDIPDAGHVRLSIFNSLGQEVATLLNQWQDPGRHYVEWNAEGYPSGTYSYQIRSNGVVLHKSCTLIK
jgi:hypothetical protein